MDTRKEHFCHVLYYYFLKGKKASEACKKLYAVYGNKTLNQRQCRNYFAKFRCGKFVVNSRFRRGCTVVIPKRKIGPRINGCRVKSTSKIAERTGDSRGSDKRRLKRFDLRKKMDISKD